MKPYVHWSEPLFAQAETGGKARALAALSQAGFAVPDFIVVPPTMANGATDVSPDLEQALCAELKRRFGEEARFAVRSSAADEDGSQHSFAGQLDSFLCVPLHEVGEKVACVRRSGFSERIYAYRKEAGLPLPPPVPGVIVQQMIEPDAAGVAFSADPVSGKRGMAVVAAVRGVGETLVSGGKNADTFHVDRLNKVAHRELSDDTDRAIEERDAVAVAKLAREAERHFGKPQDIEWAITGGKLYLLQSRPITSLCGMADPDGAFNLWDNSNIAESYSGITTPLTFSFARHIYEEVYRQLVKILGVPQERIEANRDTFSRMLGLVRGRVYYNLLSWYRVLSLLPGFSINRRFMEQMMGVKEALPENVIAGIIASHGRGAGLRDWLEVAQTVAGLVRNHWRLPAQITLFYRRLDEVLAEGDVPLEMARPDELAAAYRKLQSRLLTKWDAPLVNDFFAMIYYGLLRKLCERWCGDSDATLQNNLVTAQGGIISAEPAQRVKKLAAIASADSTLRELLATGSRHEIERGLAAYPQFADGYRAYVERFGDRCLEELKLESATLHDDPLLLLRSIGQLASHPPREESSGITDSVRQDAERRVETALAGRPIRRWIFGFVLKRARDRVRDRENLRFERTRVFGRVRRIFVELGKRLHALNVLDDPRDIFYLEAEESLGFAEGTTSTTRLRELAQFRKAEFASFADMPAPADRFATLGTVHVGNLFADGKAHAAEPLSGDTAKGIGCCPGRIRGRARVIRDPRNARIEPGEVLVALRTDPGWIMLFPAASGLLVEHGSLLSHSAIVAREMGIPAVVSIAGLTQWLQTGDLVEFDGATGVVSRIKNES